MEWTNEDDEDEFMLCNKYLDSLKLLKKNKVMIDRLTKRLSLIEKETSSISSELDAIETKLSPMLSLHVASYETSCSNNEDDATTATCTSTTLSKTRSPDRDCPQEEEEAASAHRYIHLSERTSRRVFCWMTLRLSVHYSVPTFLPLASVFPSHSYTARECVVIPSMHPKWMICFKTTILSNPS